MAIDFKYKIKKRKAIKVEQIPPLETKFAFKCKMGNDRYLCQTKVTNRNCHVCGYEAQFICWFQLPGCKKIEKYCSQCLDKWVIVPAPVPETVPKINS